MMCDLEIRGARLRAVAIKEIEILTTYPLDRLPLFINKNFRRKDAQQIIKERLKGIWSHEAAHELAEEISTYSDTAGHSSTLSIKRLKEELAYVIQVYHMYDDEEDSR